MTPVESTQRTSAEALAELRARCEGDRHVVHESTTLLGGHPHGTLVIVRYEEPEPGEVQRYECLRYFCLGMPGTSEWGVSCDGIDVSAETAMGWLAEPRAIRAPRPKY